MSRAFDNFAFPSTGDPVLDAMEAARIRRSMANEAEGMCPNGCAPLTWPDPEEPRYKAVCPKCGFTGLGYDIETYPQGQMGKS